MLSLKVDAKMRIYILSSIRNGDYLCAQLRLGANDGQFLITSVLHANHYSSISMHKNRSNNYASLVFHLDQAVQHLLSWSRK